MRILPQYGVLLYTIDVDLSMVFLFFPDFLEPPSPVQSKAFKPLFRIQKYRLSEEAGRSDYQILFLIQIQIQL